MNRIFLFILVILLFYGCKNKTTNADLSKSTDIDSCENAVQFPNAILIEKMVNSDFSGSMKNFYNGDTTKLDFKHTFTSGKLIKSEFFFENGNIKEETEFKCHSFHGNTKYYHENGKLALIVPYKYGRKDGESFLYDSLGNLKQQILFKKDSIIENFFY